MPPCLLQFRSRRQEKGHSSKQQRRGKAGGNGHTARFQHQYGPKVRWKGRGNPVTEADRLASGLHNLSRVAIQSLQLLSHWQAARMSSEMR
jgi:hypothetical protein